MTTRPLKELDTVALTEDVHEHGLVRGQVGVVVHAHEAAGAYEVEFVDDDGRTYALLPLSAQQLLLLHHRPVRAA